MTLAVACAAQFGASTRSDVGPVPPSAVGGGERYPTALADALSQITDTDLVVFGRPDRHGFLRTSVVKLNSPERSTTTQHIHMAVAAWRLTGRYRVVHFVQDNEFAAATAVVARLRRRARVYLTPVGGGRRAGLNRLKLADAFSGFPLISEYCNQAYRWLENTSRPTHVIYGGGDAVSGSTETVETGDRRYVVFVGRILPHKGIDVLLQALPADMPAVIAGPALDPDYLRHLQRVACARSLDVSFEIGATDHRLRELYRSARVTVLPSVTVDYRGVHHPHAELLGLTVLEAMWCGSPVVASALGGMREIVDPDYGVLVPPGDALALASALSMFRDPRLVNNYGAEAKRIAHMRYSWASVAIRACELYGRYL